MCVKSLCKKQIMSCFGGHLVLWIPQLLENMLLVWAALTTSPKKKFKSSTFYRTAKVTFKCKKQLQTKRLDDYFEFLNILFYFHFVK